MRNDTLFVDVTLGINTSYDNNYQLKFLLITAAAEIFRCALPRVTVMEI